MNLTENGSCTRVIYLNNNNYWIGVVNIVLIPLAFLLSVFFLIAVCSVSEQGVVLP